MASIISAGTTSGTALNMAGDTSGVLQLATNGSTTAVTVDASQNVGIGTTSPSTLGLTVYKASGSSGSRYSSGTNNFEISINGVDAYVANGANGPLQFWTNGSERMRIDSSGNVGIGNTGNANWKLVVSNGGLYSLTSGANGYFCVRGNNQTLPNSDNGTDSTPNLAISANFSNGAAEINYFNCNNSGDGHYFYQKTGAAAATNIMKISSGGNLTISGATATKASGTTWANPSDIRLKDNVQDFDKGLTELLQVNVKTWEYNGKGGTVEGTKGIGVIADEIETVLPETVDTYKAKLNAEDAEDTDIKRFDATEITWLLVNSIQEQQTIINDLKARITALEGAA